MLTESQVRAMTPTGKDYTRSDDTRARGAGRLVITVRSTGRKEWRLRTIVDGKRRFRQLGTHPEMSLEEARTAAHRAGSGGILAQPATTPHDQKENSVGERTGTLGDLAAEYEDDMRRRGLVSARQFKNSLEGYVKAPFPDVWARRAKDLKPGDFSRILAHHMNRGVTTQTNRLRSWLHAAFAYAVTADHNPRRVAKIRWGVESNPISSIPRQGDWERAGELVMTPDDIRGVWETMPSMRERQSLSLLAVQLCICTAGQRLISLLRLRPQDIHLDRMVIDLPGRSMKTKKPHVVPISGIAAGILGVLMDRCEETGSPYLFPHRSDPNKHMRHESPSDLVSDHRDNNVTSGWAIKDIRRTAKTVLGELGVSKDARDRLHGHAQHDVSSKHYDRYDYLKEKRETMKVWESWLDGVLVGKDARVTEDI